MAHKEIISIATTNPMTMRPDDKLGDAIKLMAKEGFRRLPIVHDMYLVGILTATDILRALKARDMAVLEMPLENFMTAEPIAVYRSADLTEAIKLMFEHGLGSLPIVSEGNDTLAGIVTERDLVKHFSEVADADLAEFVSPDPITLSFTRTKIGEIIDAMVDAHIRRAILVDSKKQVKGMVTSTDMLRYISDQIIRHGEITDEVLKTKAKEIAILNVRTVSVNASMADVAKMFTELGMGGVPVVDEDGALVGIFTERDLLRVVALYSLM
ncbi:MAG: CBS domain-containing protein [Candidatus Kariarchaeaceae archaeon]|jgi:CBS domain-containing protein